MARRKVNRSKLVREALATGLSKPLEVVDHIKKERGITVTKGLVYRIKSSVGTTNGRRKRGRKPGPKPKAAASSHAVNGTLTVSDITTVKGLLTRLGKDNLHELIAALA